jgi:hypothetical protein
MHYRGRHRQVAQGPKRLRRTGTVAVVAASALIAPLAFSGPVTSQAAIIVPAIDTLANHSEWRLSAANTSVAAQLGNLKRVLTERAVTYDAAKVGAYRVPTVEGYVTYVTAAPQTFTVQPNPSLLYRTPDGTTAKSATDVLRQYIEDAITVSHADAGGIGLPPVYIETTLFNMVWDTVYDSINHPPTVDLNAWINYAITVLTPYLNNVDLLVDQAMLTAEMWKGEGERLAGQAVTQALTVLNELDPEGQAAAVVNVVPLANAALPINTGTSATTPLSQPVGQPVDMGAGLVPQVDALYGDTRDEDKPEWNRNNENCYFASANAWYRQVCWRIDNQINDDTSDKTYWQFNLEASSYPLQKRGMYHVWVEGAPQSGAAAQRSDGIPKPNQELGGESGCASGTESISLSGGKPVQLGYSYSFSVTKCETYTPRGYGDEGHWSNKWHFNPDRDDNGVGYGDSDTHMRNVAFTMGIKTNATDGGPVWNLYTGTEVSKKYCC